MATFQIMISPPNKNLIVQKQKKCEEVVPRLVLAPFSPTPEVTFGEVVINSVQTRNLMIFNPISSLIIQFTNIEADDRIYIRESVVKLNVREERLIGISWSPIHVGYFRKVIRAQDTIKKARSFDIILSGVAYNAMVPLAKKKKGRMNLASEKYYNGSTSSASLSQTFKQQKLSDIRRQTYVIDEKENKLPVTLKNSKSTFKSSSPKVDNHTTILHDNLNIANASQNSFSPHDSIEAPARYFNFESDLNMSDIAGVNVSDEMNAIFDMRRSTYAMEIKEEDICLSPKVNILSNSVDHTVSITPAENFTFDLKNFGEGDVFLTPPGKLNLDSLISSPEHSGFSSLKSKSTNCLYNSDESVLSFSFKTFPREEMFFISPPVKLNKHIRKSPESFIHRTGSSAIKDRKKHLRTSFMHRKVPSPKKKSGCNNETALEKIKSQNPRALKQLVSSHCYIEDPFIKQLVYNDDEWFGKQEKDIIKWMNSILVPSAELCEECSDWTIDGAEAWFKRNDNSTENTWSLNKVPITVYNAPEKLDILRKRTKTLLNNSFVKDVFSELSKLVCKKIIYVREGRDICADEGIKSKMLQLLACYNPVWLRMGLEAVYTQEISLQSKADIGGLGMFIRKKAMATVSFIKKTEKQKEAMRRNILLRFLQLIFFLDQARMERLIRHNSCLFSLTSKYKSSQDLLNAFCTDLVTGRTYVIKLLQNIGYTLQFKQTCIDEYDYRVNSVRDLNDGIRLARLFEILFSLPGICKKLRVPAVDIENKKYNIEVAMRVAKSRCSIHGNITAEDFVLATRIGSRMKILSFLWQVINNYLAPMYEKSAVKIQRWWRKYLLRLKLRLQIRKRQEAIVKIQRVWRQYVMKKLLREKLNKMHIKQVAATVIQRFYQRYTLMKRDQKRFQQTIVAVKIIQKWFRCQIERRCFYENRSKIILIQRLFRTRKLTQKCRNDFLILKRYTSIVQRNYRLKGLMKIERNRFLSMRQAAVIIQQRYRGWKITKSETEEYLLLRHSAIVVQKRFRTMRMIKKERNNYVKLRNYVIIIQQRFRAIRCMKAERLGYIEYRCAVIQMQRRFRANKLTMQHQTAFLELRKAAITIQKRYQANKVMKIERQKFIDLKKAAKSLQYIYRNFKIGKLERYNYIYLKKAAIVIQRLFRAQKLMKLYRKEFLKTKAATLKIQRYFQSYKLTCQLRNEFLQFKMYVIIIQQHYRDRIEMISDRRKFLQLKFSALKIQTWYRNSKQMRKERQEYLILKKNVLTIQRQFRTRKLITIQRYDYTKLKWAAEYVRTRFRANRAMRAERQRYLAIRDAAIKIQQIYVSWNLMFKERDSYLKLKLTIKKIQRRYKAVRMMRRCRNNYLELRQSAIFIQRCWGTKLMRRSFLQKKKAIIKIQRWWLAKRAIRQLQPIVEATPNFSQKELAAVKIQATWKRYVSRKKYLSQRKVPLKSERRDNGDYSDPKSTLEERYKKAIHEIKTSDMYVVITYALWNLETVTTFSAKLCEGVASEDIVPILFELLARGNRSEPAMELYRASVSILINLTLYEPTKVILWRDMKKVDDILRIIHIMKMTHDKFNRKTDSRVFLYSITFLWLLCQDSVIAEHIANIPTIQVHIDKMKDTVKRRCLCAKKNNSKRIKRTLPKTVTNWYADLKTRTFDDHCFAILSLYNILFTN